MSSRVKPILRIITKAITGVLLFLILSAAAYYFFWLSPRYVVPILTYHYFGYENAQGIDKRLFLLYVTPEHFQRQMRYLKDKHYNVISLDELIEGMKKGKKFSHNTVVITIDDGDRSIYTYMYPVLKKNGFSATVFLITNRIGTNPDYLTWDQVNEMFKHGISFGGHTKSHVYLPLIKEKDILWDEIAGSKEVIEKHTGAPVDYFSYPSGGFTPEVEMLTKKAGYKGACTTNRGYDPLNKADFYQLGRISVRGSDPYFSFSNLYKPMRFRAKLSGYYNLFRKRKERNQMVRDY